MARDDRNFQAPTKQTVKGPGYYKENTYVMQSVRTRRSDVVKTTPFPNGTYHEVTAYQAFFMFATPIPGFSEEGNFRYDWESGEAATSIWSYGCNAGLVPTVPNLVLSRVRQMMDAQVRDDLDMSVMAGEARETARLLSDVLLKLLKIVKGIRSLRPGGSGYSNVTVVAARREAFNGSRSARAYLSYMYGIKPLINDVIKIANHWDERCEAPISKPLHAKVTDEDFDRSFPNTSSKYKEGRVERGVKSGAYAYVTNPQLLRASQYGLTSPLSLAWELTTLSFVVDWFTGIGAFIRGLEPPLGVSIRDYWETVYVDNNFTYVDDRRRAYGITDYVKPRQRIRLKAMNRYGSTHVLPPPPYLSLGVNSNQVLSILALILANKRRA